MGQPYGSARRWLSETVVTRKVLTKVGAEMGSCASQRFALTLFSAAIVLHADDPAVRNTPPKPPAEVRAARAQRQPVYVSRSGTDRLGGQFVAALRRELERSSVYELASTPEFPKQGILFHLRVVMVCMSDNCEEPAKKAVADVEIETLGRGAWPLPDVWYMKAFLVGRGGVHRAAKRLLADMDARWCRMCHYSSATAIAHCPKELLPDVLSVYFSGRY